MMINKRLIGAVPESKKYIAGNVALQWCSLCANIAMMSAVTALLKRSDEALSLLLLLAAVLIALLYWYFGTEQGSAIRSTGANPAMSRAQGINVSNNIHAMTARCLCLFFVRSISLQN